MTILSFIADSTGHQRHYLKKIEIEFMSHCPCASNENYVEPVKIEIESSDTDWHAIDIYGGFADATTISLKYFNEKDVLVSVSTYPLHDISYIDIEIDKEHTKIYRLGEKNGKDFVEEGTS